MSEHPFSSATPTISAQRSGGMPRVRQVLTVLAGALSAADKAPVPPNASMTELDVSMESTIVRMVRTSQEFAICETTILVNYGPIAPMDGPLIDPPQVIGPRLKALRLALNYSTQVAFAKSINLEKNTYNPWEKGTRELTFEAALLIRKKHRIPLEYLFFGEFADELPYGVRMRLGRVA